MVCQDYQLEIVRCRILTNNAIHGIDSKIMVDIVEKNNTNIGILLGETLTPLKLYYIHDPDFTAEPTLLSRADDIFLKLFPKTI